VEVLIAAFVLAVEHVAAVVGPEIASDGAHRVGRDGLGRLEWLVGALEPDIHRALVRLGESHPLGIGRELRARDFGVVEEDFAVNERGFLSERCAPREQGHGNQQEFFHATF
jgi:hypothetical protein